MLRITGGIHRSRLLQVPEGTDATRPYTARARETIFNHLRGHIDGARVLDLFSGIGTMALESASRGAAEVVAIERDPRVFRLLEANVAALGCGDRVRTVRGDAAGPIAAASAPVPTTIAFVDPPYALMEDEAKRQQLLRALGALAPRMTPDGYLVLRTPLDPARTPHEIPDFDGPETHVLGEGMRALFYQSRVAGSPEA